MQPCPRQAQEGSALVLALIAALLLFIVSIEVATTTRIESFINTNVEVDAKLDVACRAGLEKALAILREDRQQTEIDSTNDSWYGITIDSELVEADVAQEEFLFDDRERDYGGFEEESGTNLTIEIFDESAKFNVYLLLVDDPKEAKARRERLANVIERYRAGMDGSLSYNEGLDLADQIDTFLRRTAERPYRGVPKPPTKVEKTLTDISELLYVDGIEPSMMYDRTQNEGTELVPGLYRFITCWSDMQININTGELPALAGLFEPKDAFIAERILEFRDEHFDEQERTAGRYSETGSFDGDAESEDDPTGGAPFTQINELRDKVAEINQDIYNRLSNFVTVQSHVFSIYVTARRGLHRRTKMFVVRRSPNGFRVLYEKRVDFSYLIPTDKLQDAEDRATDEANDRY